MHAYERGSADGCSKLGTFFGSNSSRITHLRICSHSAQSGARFAVLRIIGAVVQAHSSDGTSAAWPPSAAQTQIGTDQACSLLWDRRRCSDPPTWTARNSEGGRGGRFGRACSPPLRCGAPAPDADSCKIARRCCSRRRLRPVRMSCGTVTGSVSCYLTCNLSGGPGWYSRWMHYAWVCLVSAVGLLRRGSDAAVAAGRVTRRPVTRTLSLSVRI